MNVVDTFGSIVGNISTLLTPSFSELTINGISRGIVGINYQYGPPKEIIDTLMQWTGSETYEPQKYPLVALFQPFEEVDGANVGITVVNNLRIIIAMGTVQDAKAASRYANNFAPILYPIYYELLHQIMLQRGIEQKSAGLIQHTKVDWPYWSNNADGAKNPFNDRLDVIEIKNMKLNFLQNYC